MDQSTVVAIVALAGSFLTVLVTGAVNIWSKWIDSEQKIKEHQLSLRSVYVNKKIEAAQDYIYKGSIIISMLVNQNHMFNIYVEAIDVDDADYDHYFKQSSLYQDKLVEIKDFSPLYFKQDQLFEDINILLSIRDEKNVGIGNLVSLAKHYHSEKNDQMAEMAEEKLINEIKEVIVVNDKLMKITIESMKLINEEMSKYDIM